MNLNISKESGHGLPVARTERGIEYQRYMRSLKDIFSGRDVDPELEADIREANAEILAVKDLTPGQVHVNEVLRTMSVMYANDEYIGTRLMPVIFTGGKLSGTYYTYNKRDRFAAPDDDMTARTDANEVSQGRSTATYSLTPRALKEFLDQLTIQNQDAPLNELMDLQENVLELLELKREQRLAAILGAAGSYGANTVALAAGDRWDTASGGDPGGVVDAAKAALWSGRGTGRTVAFCSLSVHNKLKRNPNILDQFKYAGEKPGFATRDMLREYFEVDEYLVGRARQDTANEGQTASYSRIWPDVLGIVRVAERASLRNAAFGYTVQDQPTQADMWWELPKGTKGGYCERVSRCDQELVVAADTGYLITTPIG